MVEFGFPSRGMACAAFPPPRTFSVCEAGASGDARDGALSDPEKIIMEFHVNWRHLPAQQIERFLVASDEVNPHLLKHVDELPERCDVSRAL